MNRTQLTTCCGSLFAPEYILSDAENFGCVPKYSRPESLSAFIGNLYALAVKNSSTTIRSIDIDFAKEPTYTSPRDQQTDLCADPLTS